MGSPCSFLLYEHNCLLLSLTQLPNVPNKAITNNPVQFKTVASNGLDMAQSVEPLNFRPAGSQFVSRPAGITSSDVTTGSSYLKFRLVHTMVQFLMIVEQREGRQWWVFLAPYVPHMWPIGFDCSSDCCFHSNCHFTVLV